MTHQSLIFQLSILVAVSLSIFAVIAVTVTLLSLLSSHVCDVFDPAL